MGRFTDARKKAKRGMKGQGGEDAAKTDGMSVDGAEGQEVDASTEGAVEETLPPPQGTEGSDPEAEESPQESATVTAEAASEGAAAELEPPPESVTPGPEATVDDAAPEVPADPEAEPKLRSNSGAPVLPPFGLAEDILAALDGEASSPATVDTADAGAVPVAEVLIPDVTGEQAPIAATSNDPFAEINRENGGDGEVHGQVDELRQLVTFFLGGEEYALHIAEVQEINRVVEITRVPNAPEHVRGVINLRGRIIPVIELKRRLSLGETKLDGNSRIVVAEHGAKVLGLMVDKVSAVLTVRASQIEDAPDEVIREQRNYVKGVCKLEDRMLILLNLSEVIGVAKTA